MFTTPSNRHLSLGLVFVLFLAGLVAADDKAPASAATKAEKLQAMLKERRDTLQQVLDIQIGRMKEGLANRDAYFTDDSRALLLAELELTDNSKERIRAHEKHFERAKEIEKSAKATVDRGKGDLVWYPLAEARRYEAEIGLLREQASEEPSAKEAEEIKKLLGERRGALAVALKVREDSIKAGKAVRDINPLELFRQLTTVEVEMAENANERIAAREELVKRAREYEKATKVGNERIGGRPDPAEPMLARAFRCQAEIELLRLKYGENPTAEQANEIKVLFGVRRNALQEEFRIRSLRVESGTAAIDRNLLDALRLLLHTELELADKSEQRISAFEKCLKELQEWEKFAETRVTMVGGKTREDLQLACPQTKAARLEAEIGQLRERMRASPPTK